VRSPSARSRRSSRRPLPDRRLSLVRRLAQAKQREKLGLFVVEGEDLVDAARAEGIDPVDVLVAGEDVSPEELRSVSSLAHPPRVLAVFRRDDLRRRDPPPLGLGLWRVADPGNVGTLVRTADALGPAFVALSRGCADPTGPKAVRASTGALFRVAFVDFEEAPRPWVALVPQGGDRLAPLASGTLVLGGEREGVPPELLERCDARQTIPLADGSESLNVAAAGAIALYEARRATKIVSSPSTYGRRSNQP
jgi:TrmH family RNA methyltransferase